MSVPLSPISPGAIWTVRDVGMHVQGCFEFSIVAVIPCNIQGLDVSDEDKAICTKIRFLENQNLPQHWYQDSDYSFFAGFISDGMNDYKVKSIAILNSKERFNQSYEIYEVTQCESINPTAKPDDTVPRITQQEKQQNNRIQQDFERWFARPSDPSKAVEDPYGSGKRIGIIIPTMPNLKYFSYMEIGTRIGVDIGVVTSRTPANQFSIDKVHRIYGVVTGYQEQTPLLRGKGIVYALQIFREANIDPDGKLKEQLGVISFEQEQRIRNAFTPRKIGAHYIQYWLLIDTETYEAGRVILTPAIWTLADIIRKVKSGETSVILAEYPVKHVLVVDDDGDVVDVAANLENGEWRQNKVNETGPEFVGTQNTQNMWLPPKQERKPYMGQPKRKSQVKITFQDEDSNKEIEETSADKSMDNALDGWLASDSDADEGVNDGKSDIDSISSDKVNNELSDSESETKSDAGSDSDIESVSSDNKEKEEVPDYSTSIRRRRQKYYSL